MRRGLVGVLGLVLVGAWGSDCGPPPVPLTGSIHYNTGCRMTATNPNCNSSEVNIIQATQNSGVPPAVVSCSIALGTGGMPSRLRFTIGRSMTGSLTEGDGISLCGSVSAPGTDMIDTHVQLYFDGDSSPNNPAPGICRVHINGDLTDTGFSGTLECTDALSQTSPPKLRYIQGVAGGANPTADPMLAEFSFVSCTALTTSCPQ